MSKIYVEIDNEFFAEVGSGMARVGWTITAEVASGSRTTTVAIDAPDAPPEIDRWLCSPTLGNRADGSVAVLDYGPLKRMGWME